MELESGMESGRGEEGDMSHKSFLSAEKGSQVVKLLESIKGQGRLITEVIHTLAGCLQGRSSIIHKIISGLHYATARTK